MNYNGWYYNSASKRAPSWTGVDEFYNFAINNQSNYGPKVKTTTLENIEIGDVIQLCQKGRSDFHHTLIIVKILGNKTLNNILIACHTNDAYNKRLTDYNFIKIRFLKVFY